MNALGIVIIVIVGAFMLFEIGSFVHQIVQRKKDKKETEEITEDNVIK